MVKWKVCIKPLNLCLVLNKAFVWLSELQVKVTIHKVSFLPGRIPDKLWLFSLGYLVNVFCETNKENSCFPTDKIRAFKQRYENWKICICNYKLKSFLILKVFSDEKCDSLILYNNIMSTFGKAAQFWKTIFLK